MFTRRLLLSITLMLVAPGVVLAAPHPATYAKRVGTLGVKFDVNGQSYKLVKVPFKAFEGGKYAIIYPIRVWDDNSLGGGLFTTVHSDKPFKQNTTISGFPAYISIQDSRDYDLHSDTGTDLSFVVQGRANGTVTIQVGETLVSLTLSQHHQGDNPDDAPFYWNETDLDVEGQVNVTPYAEWPKWRDLKPEAAALDTLLDYVQIIAL